MRIVRIKSKTNQGTNALRKGIIDDKQSSLVQKLLFSKLGFTKTLTENPCVLTIEIRNKYYQALVVKADFKRMIETRMKTNGASKKDYTIEFED